MQRSTIPMSRFQRIADAGIDHLARIPPGSRLCLRASILLLLISGCSTAPFQTSPGGNADTSPGHELRIARVMADAGLKKLGEHRYEDASRIFNAGLKFSPADARLHFLNGLAYHLQYLRGNETMKDLAVAGYELALSNDPALYYAALQLGRLQFYAKRYVYSVEAFQRAIDIQPKSGDAHLGLAKAAYYARDLARARTAANKAASLRSTDAEATRTLAMVYAALGENAMANAASAHFGVLEKDEGARARLAGRVSDWRAWHESSPSSPEMGGQEPVSPPLSQQFAQTAQSAGWGREVPTPQGGPARRWFDCASSESGPSAAYGAPSGSDDLAPMPRLPTPCAAAGNPRMAVLDVAIIRSEDNASSTYGTNLLQSLSYAFSATRTVSAVLSPDPTRAVATTDARDRIVGVGVGSIGSFNTGTAAAYALNIANSTDNRAEVLARPSLVALDGMPSAFFSGRNVTMGIAGTGGSASTITDKPVGISLSVTPTFIDSETMLLAVKAQRSFIEAVDASITFTSAIQASRNAVSANVLLKMGQTLILSGLSEREIQRASSGVPVLKDIPVLQYLFSQKTTLDFTTSVLILITPRPPATDQEMMSKTIGHIDSLTDAEKRKLRSLIERRMEEHPRSTPPNLEGTYGHVLGNTLFLQFRTGDLTMEHWSTASRLNGFFQDLRDMLYF